ncbi:MAG: hypothetical protein FJ399_05845, partial [Verrucomicrobia bacterium]|nr:hypothetical protein [Verrucomicrobiota bacterium]
MNNPAVFPMRLLAVSAAFGMATSGVAVAAPALRQMELLDRGVVAIHQPDGRVAVSWRLLATDPEGVAFNLYRKSDLPPGGRGGSGAFGGRGAPAAALAVAPSAVGGKGAERGATPAQPPGGGRGGGRGSRGPGGFGGGDPTAPRKLNEQPLTGPTFFVDDTANLAAKTSYFVRAIVGGSEQEPSAAFALPAGAPPLPYLSVPLQPPEGAQPGDASAGDLDGDGQYDLVLKLEQRPRDNSQGGATGTTFLQGYRLDAAASGFTSRLLWTINLGRNIREGAHYT